MIILFNLEDIYCSWGSLVFSEAMIQQTFRFICKDCSSNSQFFAKNFEIKNHIFWYFLSPSSKKYSALNQNHLSYLEEIKLNILEKKNSPDYWVKEYDSWLDSKKKLNRTPDCGEFKIPEVYKIRFSYDSRIANIP